MIGTTFWRRMRRPTVTVDGGGVTPTAPHGRVRRLIRVVSGVMMFCALAVIVFIGAGVVGNPWYRIVSIDGGSMEPTISFGSMIIVAPAPAKVEPGMILVLTVEGQRVTHRVVAINPDGTLVTRGDANRVVDSWSGQQIQVDGQYVATVPWLGNFLHVADSSEALFADGVTSQTNITVGPWASPASPDPSQPGDANSPIPTVAPTPIASDAPTTAPTPSDEPTVLDSASPSLSPSESPADTP